MELKAAGKDMPELRIIARQLIDKAKEGDLQAQKEFLDRLDGKPAQALDISGAIDTSPNRLSDEELEAIVVAQQQGHEGKTLN